ncbi:hypothetical protein G6F61_014942 [Rhizopus arrhizus]|nr:hypothetical protein G6F61_014942 [Rhizopus arrhizus]
MNGNWCVQDPEKVVLIGLVPMRRVGSLSDSEELSAEWVKREVPASHCGLPVGDSLHSPAPYCGSFAALVRSP